MEAESYREGLPRDGNYYQCLHWIYAEAREDVLFVHGTTTSLFGNSARLEPKGIGEYGVGFYGFLACGAQATWGLEKASDWAKTKATLTGKPCLVHFAVSLEDFDNLSKDRYDRDNCSEAARRFDSHGVSGYDVVIGPIVERDVYGQWGPDGSFPCQFKFEAPAIKYLRILRVEILS